MTRISATNELLENAKYGFAAGAITGTGISGFELLKVKMQVNPDLRLYSIFTKDFVRANWKTFLHTAPTFGLLFGGACAIEFSTNAALEKQYGPAVGLTASAFNCAVFLTAADHLMFRNQKFEHLGVSYPAYSYRELSRYFAGSRFPRLFAGYAPMYGRELLFGLSVLYTGPLLGEYIKKQGGASDNGMLLDLMWRFIGTFLSALATTAVSQPFDRYARQMQIQYRISNDTITPRFRDAVFTLAPRELYRGFIPRLVLASVGAGSIGALFKLFKGVHTQPGIHAERQAEPIKP